MRALALTLLLMLAAPATAHANRLSMFRKHGQLYFRYYGSKGEANRLTVRTYAAGDAHCGKRGQACYFVADSAAAGNVNAGGGCFSEDSAYPGQAECDFPGGEPVHMTIDLGDRNDTLTLNTDVADATISGGDGNDVIETGGAAKLTLAGGAGDDTLEAAHDGDRLYGGDGDDRLIEPPDCRVAPAYGGPGTDTVIANPACAAGTTLDLRHIAGVEDATGSPGPDKLIGTAGPNTLSGRAGDDSLYGNGGNDVLDGGDGIHNVLYGGGGNDTLTSDYGSLYGGDGDDKLTTGMVNTHLGPAGVLQGGAGGDVLRCGHVVCRTADGPGDDRVYGSDDLYGDVFFASAGADTYFGDGAESTGGGLPAADCSEFSCAAAYMQPDLISYRLDPRGVSVTLDGDANDGMPGEHDNVVGVGAVIGTAFDDELFAEDAPVSFFGGPGNDVLSGGNGADDLVGGPGDDKLTGGPGADGFVCGLGNDVMTDYTSPPDTEFTCAR